MDEQDSDLPSLFCFENCPIEFVLVYLYQRKSPEAQAFLITKLYSAPTSHISTFLPQLVNLAIQHDPGSYLCLFQHVSLSSSSFALKLYWFLQAHLDDRLDQYRNNLEFMISGLEKTISQGDSYTHTAPPHLYPIDIEEDKSYEQDRKEVRRKYFAEQHKYALSLVRVSITLIAVPDDSKDITLQAYIKNLDTYIKHKRFLIANGDYSEYSRRLFRGIIIPIDFGDTEHIEQVVRLVVEECKCYKTKARVPYKLVFETIDINEFEPMTEEEVESATTIEIEAPNEIYDKNIRYQGLQDFDSNEEVSDITETEDSDMFPWENWNTVANRIRSESPFGHFRSWKARAVIVKGCDDLRQELLAMQIIKRAKEIFQERNVDIFLRPYEIVVVNGNSGILECIPNCASIHAIKKANKDYRNLANFFNMAFCENYEECQKNFAESMAGYSLICYLLNLKDRHNGNILLDELGHIIHIDFGFFLTSSPGGNANFETAPFKLTSEMVTIMGGKKSEIFNYYKIQMYKGLLALRNYSLELALMLEMMKPGETLQCFNDPDRAIREFKARFHLELDEAQCFELVNKLVDQSLDNWKTVKYDTFQRLTNGILS